MFKSVKTKSLRDPEKSSSVLLSQIGDNTTRRRNIFSDPEVETAASVSAEPRPSVQFGTNGAGIIQTGRTMHGATRQGQGEKTV
jgi:hypothetical protein